MLLIYIKGNCSIRYQSLKTVCLFCICIQTATNLYFLELVTTRLRDVPRSKSLYTIVIRNIHSDNWLLVRYKLNYFVLPDKNEIRVIRRQRRLLGVIILAPFFLLIEVQSLVQHLIEKKLFRGKFPRNHEKTVDRRGRKLSFFELERYSAMADHHLQKSLEDAISEFKCYNDRTTSLFKRTSTCFQEILESIDIGSTEAEDTNTLIPFSQLDEVERELRKSPSVFFIGERNCGKSSIINELLQQSSLPVHENPCTARIVRIKYSDEPYAVLLRSDGVEVGRKAPTRGRIPEELIVVTDQDRENENALDATVEVGLKHELLRSGIELIDSPGKGESDVLDTVLNEYLEKGSVPLFVYVIDGKVHLRGSVSLS